MKASILIIEDDRDMCDMLSVALGRRGFSAVAYQSGMSGLAAIDSGQPDVILVDINLPDINGMEVCQRVSADTPDLPVVVMTAFGNMDMAIEAIRAGAYDFITKPVDMDMLALALDRAVQYRMLHKQLTVLSRAAETAPNLDCMIGESQVMRELFQRLTKIADTGISVLITGESGAGKEVAARALHNLSRRKQQPFVAINCSTLTETLLESELFGHVKGAFTDACSDRKGLFQEADGGTLFLDEIADFPLSLQPKLLRVIEERRVRPIGTNSEYPFDVRILAATNRDIEAAVAAGEFREDLFYRLNVITAQVPPLRERGADRLLLAARFISDCSARQGKQVTGIDKAAAKKILNYSWPGNVRELRNAMEHAVALADHQLITPEDLPEKITSQHHLLESVYHPADLVSLEEMTNRYINYILGVTEGNQSLAAQILEIDRKTLYRRLNKSS
ncbi:sigma-54-dependent transcriptional regulator [Desulfofustis glycolicus]|uniref:Two-component system, NtrC family, response regulator n=1 Tax=Desulfofustis glycolicus DSM 9705 TaxID=1121409 RepID=A0A1M5TKP9_9BACT|nr:sigma-54 dependent transcriptional regulator [Desulfofustis glycolicus]MCB2216447.1 sigma-54 dependent transcriptional regulator [Desulfobulbaceae bacterium]SHH50923.1 two-component system, NtrC family, response regulator [Desulfofustis glycolicus DSM 9705]